MKQRCLNPRCKAYKNYGARGINVCDEWMEFEPFCEWALNNGYEKGLDLDRENNDGNYSPQNCRWVTRRSNINNRRKTTYLVVNGESKPRTEWEKIAGIPYGVVKEWIKVNGKVYAEKRIEDALKNGYIEKNYTYGHKKIKVRCKETGEVFDTIKSAADHFGISSGYLSVSLRKTGRVGEHHFEMVE